MDVVEILTLGRVMSRVFLKIQEPKKKKKIQKPKIGTFEANNSLSPILEAVHNRMCSFCINTQNRVHLFIHSTGTFLSTIDHASGNVQVPRKK